MPGVNIPAVSPETGLNRTPEVAVGNQGAPTGLSAGLLRLPFPVLPDTLI